MEDTCSMGDLESGGWPEEGGRNTTDELFALDVRALKRADLIDPGQELVEGVAHL
jgi:hypothetical protein